MSVAPSDIALGIAGWSYADWRGVVYPRGCRDELRFVARYVDCIEINSTFYNVPTRETVSGWAERTADLEVFFTVKLPMAVTHERRLERGLVDSFADALQPLRAAGRLHGVFAQFHARFDASPAAVAFLRAVADAFCGLAPLVLEVRHASWRDLWYLEQVSAMGWSVAQLDYPESPAIGGDGFDGVVDGVRLPEFGYLRAHGRNTSAWTRRDAGRDEVYDYCYPQAERSDLLDRVRHLAAAEQSARTIVVANNHFQGQALKLVLELKAEIEHARVDVPDPLLAAYPELREIARGVLF